MKVDGLIDDDDQGISSLHGQGIYYFGDGCRYQGEWINGKYHGGIYSFQNGAHFKGEGVIYAGAFYDKGE